MPSRLDRLAARHGRWLARQHGERTAAGALEGAIVWIDPHGKEYPATVLLDEERAERDDAAEFTSQHSEGRREFVDATCYDPALAVTDRWTAKLMTGATPETYQVEAVRRTGHSFTATLRRQKTTRIQRDGLE